MHVELWFAVRHVQLVETHDLLHGVEHGVEFVAVLVPHERIWIVAWVVVLDVHADVDVKVAVLELEEGDGALFGVGLESGAVGGEEGVKGGGPGFKLGVGGLGVGGIEALEFEADAAEGGLGLREGGEGGLPGFGFVVGFDDGVDDFGDL